MTVCRLVLLSLLLLSPARAFGDGGAPLSPAAGWATSYLVNATILAEYLAVVDGLAKDGRDAALRSEPGQALWRRAAFARAALEARSQDVPEAARVTKELAAHAALLKDVPGFAEVQDSLLAAARGDARLETDPKALAGHTAVAATFGAEPMRRLWLRLARAYGVPSPSCPIDAKDVQTFADHQRKVLDGGRGVSPPTLLAPIAGWGLVKVQCLAFALMAVSSKTAPGHGDVGLEPIHLMTALQQTGSPLARDASLKALTAVRLMQLARFGETLSLIMDLTDLDEAYRIPYETVQRVFSLRQKGEGQVALQGL